MKAQLGIVRGDGFQVVGQKIGQIILLICTRRGGASLLKEEYDALEPEFQLVREKTKVRHEAGTIQDELAGKIGTVVHSFWQ